MRIEVRLFATLREVLPTASRQSGVVVVDLPAGSTVDDLARTLGIPDTMPRVALVNGQEAGPARSLAPDDVVSLFPPLAGGRDGTPAGTLPGRGMIHS